MWRRSSRTYSYTHANANADSYANTYSDPIAAVNIKYGRSTTAKLHSGANKFIRPSSPSVWNIDRFSQRPMWKHDHVRRFWLR
jgi:hypothetical protein